MHESSYRHMGDLVARHLADCQRLSVLDLGSQDVNGSYRPLFDRAGWTYRGVDLAPGRNVDLVLSSPYVFPLASATADLVISGQAFEHVAGYACYNDGSIREWQFHAKQIASGKNFESTGGFGPWMVTADEIEPNRPLKLEVRLNGEVLQSSHTGHMIFNIAKLINYASTIFTLSPGDVIATGTPAGVGWSRKPQRFMKAGDVCEVEIEGIGVLRNPIVAQA